MKERSERFPFYFRKLYELNCCHKGEAQGSSGRVKVSRVGILRSILPLPSGLFLTFLGNFGTDEIGKKMCDFGKTYDDFGKK